MKDAKNITDSDVEKMCRRFLDSEEHAGEAAIPAVAEDAVDLLQCMSSEMARLKNNRRDK